jgi:hypothetical protein
MGQTVNLLTYVFGGSNPSAPTIQTVKAGWMYQKCGSSSAGRAIAFQAIGREFEPRLPLQKEKQALSYLKGLAFWSFTAEWFFKETSLRQGSLKMLFAAVIRSLRSSMVDAIAKRKGTAPL